MNYCFDISAAPYGTGVSRYTTNLARALSRTVSHPDTFSVFGGSLRQLGELKTVAQSIPATSRHLFPLPPRFTSRLFNQLDLPIDPFIGPCDVFHSWDWYLPQSSRTVVVTTVHDLALFKFPDIAHPEIKRHHQEVMERLKRLNSAIIAVSAATKQDLIELFGIDPARIEVIYEALPAESQIIPSAADIAAVKTKYSITKPYLLMVGTLEPRKNYPRQIEAWRQYQHDFDLVIVGKSGWETINPEPGLIRIGYAAGKELAALYRGAEGLLYCSLAEGFGLPLLEAFFHQLPVVTSDVSSLAEIVNGAAVKVNPTNVEAIAAGIAASQHSKADLIQQGAARLQDFSWDQAARETLAFYRKVTP